LAGMPGVASPAVPHHRGRKPESLVKSAPWSPGGGARVARGAVPLTITEFRGWNTREFKSLDRQSAQQRGKSSAAVSIYHFRELWVAVAVENPPAPMVSARLRPSPPAYGRVVHFHGSARAEAYGAMCAALVSLSTWSKSPSNWGCVGARASSASCAMSCCRTRAAH
jgi:hypothetical protein